MARPSKASLKKELIGVRRKVEALSVRRIKLDEEIRRLKDRRDLLILHTEPEPR